MPYRSKAQHRLFRVLEAQGKLPKGTASEWAHHTPSMKKLPEHVKKHKTKQAEMIPQAPPNYRLALGQVNTCGNCLNYEPGAGNCNKYKVPVANDHVCDAYNQNKTMVSQIRLKNNLSRPVKLDNSLSGPSPTIDLTSGVSDLKLPEVKAAAAFNNSQAPPMTNPIRPIAGVGFGGSGQKPVTLGMAGNRPQPGGNTVPPGAIIQWLNSQAQQLMQSRRQQPQPAQPQPQPAPTAKQAGFFGLLADEINTLSLKQANTPLPKPAPAPKSPTSPTPAPPPAPKATQPAAGGNLNDPFHNAGSSDGDDKKDPFHSVVPDAVNNKPDPYQNVGITDETPSTFANPSPGNGGQPPKAAPVATTSGGQSTQPAAPAQPQQPQAQPQQQPISQAEQLATAAVTAPIQQARDANRPLTDAERIAIGAVNAPKDKAYEEIYKTLKPEDIPSNPHAQLALNNRPKETNYKVQDPQEQPASYDSIRARMQALGNRQSAPLPVPQSVDGAPLGPEAGLLPSAGRFLKGFPAALGRAAGEYYNMAQDAIMPEPTTTPLPKPSGPVQRVDPTPVSQQKVPAPNIETPGPQFISNKIQEPTAAGAAQTPYIDKLEHKGKAPLTDGMHSSEFKRLQDQIGFTDQTQKRFNDNLPYDPDNRSREHVSNFINSPVSLKGGLNAQRAADHLANQFKDQAGREYTNNMFQHAQPPKMYQLDPKEDTAYYSPRTKSMGMSDNYNNIDTYMHELTHGLGARSGSSAKRVPYVNNNLPGREGQTYDPDAEYPAMVAGHLARLKTNQRAHEMGQSTQLPAQLAGALGSANPFASTVGALAGNRGAATLTMPAGNIIHPQERHKLKDNYSRSLGTAMDAANNNNYFTPQSPEDTANIYPTLNKALPHMMLEKQNSDFLSLLRLEKQAIGARSKRLARFEAAASNKQRAEAIEAAVTANRKLSQPLSFWDKLRGVKNKEKLVDIPETTVPIRSLANQDIRQRADEIAKMQARPGGYGNEYRKSFEDLPPLSEVANAYERQTNSLYKKFANPTSQAYSDRVQELLRMHGDPKIFGPGTGLHAKLWFRGDKPYKNMTDAMRAAMDRLAATGRHANVRNDGIPNVLADFIPLNKEMENPNLAYAGFSSTQLRPRRMTIQTPEQIAAKESPAWYSGYPQVSANYIQKTMRPGVNRGYLIEAPVDKLKEVGPHSPNFHPHKAVDTRGFTPEAVNALPNWKGETTPPHYESVFTAKSDDVLSTPISRLFKLLPSGSDFQRVK